MFFFVGFLALLLCVGLSSVYPRFWLVLLTFFPRYFVFFHVFCREIEGPEAFPRSPPEGTVSSAFFWLHRSAFWP